MPDGITFAIRDLVPHPDVVERPAERELKLHHVAQAQLKRKYKTFHAEATLAASITVDEQTVAITGRLDGYRRTPKGIVLYEIKSVPGDPRHWVNSPLLQNARWQLQLYADLARLVEVKPWGRGEVTEGVLCLISETQRQSLEPVEVRLSAGLLEKRVRVVLAAAHPWRPSALSASNSLERFIDNDRQSDRPEQTEAWRNLCASSAEPRLLLSMPPGSGKTRIAVRHALHESFARNRRVYWITTKARGRDEVLAELRRYREAGIPLRVLWKTARERLCDCASPGFSCPRRLETRAALFVEPLAEIRDAASWNPADLQNFAREHSYCASELSDTLERDADVIIADINYLLNPSPLSSREAIVVLDEAQNIAHRVYENSNVKLRRDELAALLDILPQPARRTVRELLAARIAGDEPSSWLAERIANLRDQLSRVSSDSSAVSTIRRAARFSERFRWDYRFAWYRHASDSALLGSLTDAGAAIDSALAPHAHVLALSGSLPADASSRAALFPPAGLFTSIEVLPKTASPVFIVPDLIFKYPLTSEDHWAATELLRKLREHFPPTIAVFGQNRASNEFLSMSLRVRGFTVMLDEDLAEDWSTASAVPPDFLFIAIGGSLSEAINPPADLFSGAAILSPAFRAPDEFDLLRSAMRQYEVDEFLEPDTGADFETRRAEAVSRVIQAAGRVQRSPRSRKPVFLLNRDFAEAPFLRAWPRAWYADSPHELVYSTLDEALEHMNNPSDATR